MKRLIILAGVATGVAAPAQAQRVQVSPYIEASQVVASDLNGGDVLTYSTVGAGVDVSAHTRRVEVQVSYRYEHRFDYQNKLNNDHTHSGLATVRATVAPGFSIEAGGIATRTRSDIRGDVQTSNVGNFSNSAQVFSAYVGPNLATHLGPMFVNGAYRFGYTKVEAPGSTGVDPSQPRLDYYDDSTVHVATASVGVKSGTVLPVGITASGSYTRENAGQLDQRFEGKWGRGDIVLPVLRGLALAGGVGYEQIKITQRDALTVGGVPVVDGAGRFRTDPNSPRRIAYDLSGVFWDAGVIWKPSRRTFFEARVGRRYGSMSYTGSLSYQAGPGSGIQIGVYDTVQTFGQQLNGGITNLPTALASTTDPFGNEFSGCIYGTTGAATGGCMTGIFASATTSAYRGRGVTGVAVMGRGGTRVGIGGGWAKRDFIAPTGGGTAFTTNGTSDTTIYGQLFASTDVGANGSLQGSVIGSYYDSDLAGSDGIYGWGANAAYTHRFGRLGATLSTGIFGFERDGESSASAQALLGLRYGF